MSGSDNPDADSEGMFREALAKIDQAKQQTAEALAQLQPLSNSIRNAPSRGQINQQIWNCMRALGQQGEYFSQSGQDAFLDRFGFGHKTGIDIAGEVSGLSPSREWKNRARHQPWFPGETVITGIGQGFTLVTPLQLATTTAALACTNCCATSRKLTVLGPKQTALP